MKRSFAVFLSFLIFFSSLHFKLSAHFCGERLVDVSLLGDAKPCSMSTDNTCKLKQASCCADEVLIIEGEDYLASKDLSKTTLKKQASMQPLTLLSANTLFQQHTFLIIPNCYVPPLIAYEIPILHQAFLL